MNASTPTEILELTAATSYSPVWISTDRRQQDVTKTTLKYAQVGGPTAADKVGNAHGPIFRIEVLNFGSANGIKIWGLDNDDDNAVEYPKSRFTNEPILDIWLQKYEFTNGSGTTVDAGASAKVFGHRSRHYPASF